MATEQKDNATSSERSNWTKLKLDINGNPRHVTSWCGFGFKNYNQAIRAANSIGGRKYHTKSFGGGLMFPASACELARIEASLKTKAAESA